jgi:hypothetical protein
VSGIGLIEEYDTKPRVDALARVEELADRARFRDRSVAAVDIVIIAVVPAGPCFGADDKDAVGFADLSFGPVRPSFVGTAGPAVPVDADAKALDLAEPLGETADALAVLVTVMTVAEKHDGHAMAVRSATVEHGHNEASQGTFREGEQQASRADPLNGEHGRQPLHPNR